MTNLSILIKNNFKIMLGNFQGKKKRASTLSATLLLLLCAGAIVAFYTYQAWTMFDNFVPLGLADMLIFHAMIIATTVVVTIGVMRVTVSANSSDEWFLLSMPIKRRDIIVAKMLNRYLFDLAFVALIIIPFVVLYLIMVKFTTIFLVLGIILTLALPLLSVAISNILGFIVSKMFNRFRSANLYKSLISVFIFIMIYGLMLIKTTGYGFVEQATMEEFFNDRPISNLLLKFLLDPNALRIVLVALLVLVPFVIGFALYTVNFGKSAVGYHTNSTIYKFNKGKSIFGSMLKKELYTYATTTAYITNTIIGPILMLGLSILIATSSSDGLLGLLFGLMPSSLTSGLIAMIFSACVALTTISACTISLEGKSLWLLKSMPVNEKMLFLAKAVLHLIIILPFVVASAIIVAVSMEFALIDWLIVLLVPTFTCILFAFGGVLINLWLPLLEWEDETKVVKQSMAVLVAMLSALVVSLLPLGIYKLFPELSMLYMFLIYFGIMVLTISVVCLLLFTWGVKKFRAITE